MRRTYYVLLLDDPANPDFVSGEKPYFGTDDHIKTAAGLMRCRETYGDTVAAIDDYFCGNKKAIHTVAYRKVPILTTATWVSEAVLNIGDRTWEHINTWGFAYKIRCDSAFLTQVVLKYERKYCRCYRVWFTNLKYEEHIGKWAPILTWWGHRDLMLNYHLLEGRGYKLNNVLYLLDKKYDTLEEAVDSLTNPNELCFTSFFGEIFGDG